VLANATPACIVTQRICRVLMMAAVSADPSVPIIEQSKVAIGQEMGHGSESAVFEAVYAGHGCQGARSGFASHHVHMQQ
jgi:N-methylhydantoinase B/oxoprolinase/acetone carboxylase alpha subunit